MKNDRWVGLRETFSTPGIQNFIALVLASVGAYYCYGIAERRSAVRLALEHPHDGQIFLGALVVGLFAAAVLWIALFGVIKFGFMRWAKHNRR